MAVAGLAGCTSTNGAGNAGGSTTDETSVAPTPQTLPGESLNDATFRIESRCFAKYGITLTQDAQDGINGDLYPGTTPTRSVQDLIDECVGEVNKAGLNNAPARTEEQLRAEYTKWVGWAACLNAAGYEIGSIVSYEEFAAGNTWPAPGYLSATNGMTDEQRALIDGACEPPIPVIDAPDAETSPDGT